jgi:hypothetical protein
MRYSAQPIPIPKSNRCIWIEKENMELHDYDFCILKEEYALMINGKFNVMKQLTKLISIDATRKAFEKSIEKI